MLTEPNQNPAPAFVALEWNGRKCANRECKLDHLIGVNSQTEEALGEVAGPDGLELYAAFFRGRQIGQYANSVAAMAAINKMYERHQAEQARMVSEAPGIDPDSDLGQGMLQAMRMVQRMMGANGPRPIGVAVGHAGEPPQFAQMFAEPAAPAIFGAPTTTIEMAPGQAAPDEPTMTRDAAMAACAQDRGLVIVEAENGVFLGRNLGIDGNGMNFRPIVRVIDTATPAPEAE